MPWTPEQKKADRERKKKIEEDRALLLGTIDKYKLLDEKEEYAVGEASTWTELWKIFQGLDPKADPEAKPKEGVEFINPSIQKFLGKELTIEEWLELRHKYRGDLWQLMQLVGRGRWSEQAHKPLAEFFVKKDNSRLKYGYSQSQMQAVLFSQDVVHQRLLLYPRGNRKSTVNLIDTLQWIINFANIVILICTNTKGLGKRFVKELRGYFVVKDYKRPTPFQILFPEYCIPEDKGKKSGDVREFWCPLARLGLKDPTLSFTSMESGTAGVRADVIKFDDAVDEINYKNPEQRTVVNEKFDATLELLVGDTGFWEAVGTRYTDGLRSDSPEGAVPDMYGTILKNYDGGRRFKKLIASAWTVHEEFRDVPLKQLERHMVDLLFPTLPCVCGKEDNDEYAVECSECHSLLEQSPGNFESLMGKCKKNILFFRCQQLNEPAAELDDEEAYINTFTEDNIRAQTKSSAWIATIKGTVRRYLFVDTAMTAGRKSDYSAFAVIQIEDRGEDMPPLIWILEVRADRYIDVKVAETIAELMQKWSCGAYVEEIPGTGMTFKNEVKKQIWMRNCQDLPFMWFTPSQEPKAKETRIRGFQILHDRGLVRFIMGQWIDLMIKQLTDYAGHKPKGKTGRKDDIPDVLSYVYKVLPYIAGVQTDEQKKEQEEREKKAELKRQYDRLYGPQPGLSNSFKNAPSQEDAQSGPIHRALSALNPMIQGEQLSWPKRSGNTN